MDPITRYTTLDGYLFNIQMLRRVFAPSFLLHSVTRTGPLQARSRHAFARMHARTHARMHAALRNFCGAQLTTRWTMAMKVAVNPLAALWSPELLFTGVSILGVNPDSGRLCRQAA
jgi:hypothetical protein